MIGRDYRVASLGHYRRRSDKRKECCQGIFSVSWFRAKWKSTIFQIARGWFLASSQWCFSWLRTSGDNARDVSQCPTIWMMAAVGLSRTTTRHHLHLLLLTRKQAARPMSEIEPHHDSIKKKTIRRWIAHVYQAEITLSSLHSWSRSGRLLRVWFYCSLHPSGGWNISMQRFQLLKVKDHRKSFHFF